MIYKFRVILDVEEDVIRDIAIEKNDTLEDFHNAITQSFGFVGNEMASFYISDEQWNQGEEITLFDFSDNENNNQLMHQTIVGDLVHMEKPYLLYVYDFFNIWTFFVELKEVEQRQPGLSYPTLLFAHGSIPTQAPEKKFNTENQDNFDDEFASEFNDFDLDEEDYGYFDDNEFYR